MTTFYWRSITPDDGPGNTTQSIALPWGTDVTGNQLTSRATVYGSLSETINPTSSFNSLVRVTAAQTARQSGLFAVWVSEPLAAQTVSAQTWTMFVGNQQSNSRADAYTAASLYIWRSGAVASYIFDAAQQLGSEWTTTTSVESFTASLGSFTLQASDRLVLEVWYTSAQVKAQSYQNTLLWGGNDDTTTGNGNGSPASYISLPQTLNFLGDSNIALGDLTVTKAYLGDLAVSAAYLGDVKVL